MGKSAIFDEIQAFNLSYLLLAQKLLRVDRLSAKFRLHLDDEVADLIVALDTDQLLALSSSSQLLMNLALDASQLKLLTSNPRAPDQASVHASILLLSQPANPDLSKGQGE